MKRNKQTYTFIDLFAGLGGFHIALESLGCKCVFTSELKEDLRQLYKLNFPDVPLIEGDITKVDLTTIPHHDILCAGFPCQPFSQAGKRKDENGRRLYITSEFNENGRLIEDVKIGVKNNHDVKNYIQPSKEKIQADEVIDIDGNSLALSKEMFAKNILEKNGDFANVSFDAFKSVFDRLKEVLNS